MRGDTRCRFGIYSQPRGVLNVSRDSMPGGDRKNYVISAKSLETKRSVHAPAENGIRSPVWQERCDRAKHAGDLEMAALELLPEPERAIGAGSIRLGCELGSRELHVGTGLFHGDVKSRTWA